MVVEACCQTRDGGMVGMTDHYYYWYKWPVFLDVGKGLNLKCILAILNAYVGQLCQIYWLRAVVWF